MAQYRTGSVFCLNGSAAVYGAANVNWSSIVAGNWFTVVGSNLTYTIASTPTQDTTSGYAAYAGGTTYAAGNKVYSAGQGYISIVSGNVGNTPISSPAQWFPINGWNLTLSATYAGSTTSSAAYGIVNNFSPVYNLPLPQPGDVEVPAIVSRAFLMVETVLENTTVPNYQTGNYSLLLTDSDVVFTGTSPATFTMPSAASIPGKQYTISNMGSATLTVSATSTGQFYTMVSGVNTITLSPGQTLIPLALNGTWKVSEQVFVTTGTGIYVLQTSPTLITPVLGAATATSINGVTIPVGADTVDLLGTIQTLSAAKTFSATATFSNATTAFTVSGSGAVNLGSGTTTVGALTSNGNVSVKSGLAVAFYDSANVDFAYIKNTGSNDPTQTLSFVTSLEALTINRAGNVQANSTFGVTGASTLTGAVTAGSTITLNGLSGTTGSINGSVNNNGRQLIINYGNNSTGGSATTEWDLGNGTGSLGAMLLGTGCSTNPVVSGGLASVAGSATIFTYGSYPLTFATAGVAAMWLDTSQNLIQASGAYHQFGRAYSSGVVTATGTIDVKDSSGTVYHMLVHN